ncbi:Flexible cuticle protein 12 [Pseudolycoriella hygida]|uniref:Flexible cuticle protein 12 n=1 Tax=Pseudolycoriella hygida TaxID=35572 RepID=A0A9Q0S5I5_9DIPT|nr:Flexible cuticle protein 12 [Pseudolycoriella hygida]
MIETKYLLLLTLIVISCDASDDQAESEALVVKFENKSNGTEKYAVIYELSNGIIHFESGRVGSDIVEGTYWFVGPDNVTYSIDYYADENSFQPLLGSGSGVDFKVLASAIG